MAKIISNILCKNVLFFLNFVESAAKYVSVNDNKIIEDVVFKIQE